MRTDKLKNNFLYIIFLLTFSFFYCDASIADKFYMSSGKYALCTTAECFPIPGQVGMVLCHCKVANGNSAGQEPNPAVQTTAEGYQLIKSRYYPVETYVQCSNNRPWAFCLDSPCIIDKDDPLKAMCTCSVAQNQGPYIIPTDTCSKSLCEDGQIYSAALVSQDNDIEAFLKSAEAAGKFPAAQKKLCK